MAYDPVRAKQYEDLYNQLEDIRQRMDAIYGEAFSALLDAHRAGLLEASDARAWAPIRAQLSTLEVYLPSLQHRVYRG